MWVRPIVVCGLWLLAAGGLMGGGRAIPLVADDAYYYFEISRNAALGQGFTFDSVAPTNGFHPLWGWLLVPIFRLFPMHERLPILIALGISLVCMVATALLLVRLFARHGARLSGEIAAYAWLLNPFGITLALRGMEGPLNALVLMVSISTFDALRSRARYSVRDVLVLGGTVGLAILARTDNVLWLGSVGAVLAWALWRPFGPGRTIARLACLGGAAAVVASPWLLWNLATFGTVTQTSVDAKRIFQLYGELPAIAPDGIDGVGAFGTALVGAGRNLATVVQAAFRYAAVEEWTPPHRASALMAIAALAGVVVFLVAFLLRRHPAPEATGLRTLAGNVGVALGLFFLAHFFVYAFVIGTYSNWYFLPPVLMLSIGLGLRTGWVSALRRPWATAVVLAHVGFLVLVTLHFTRGHFLSRRDEWERLRTVGEALPPGTRVGLWNAGVVGYVFSFRFPDRAVINLDGVVNNEIVRAAHAGRYEQYVLDNVDVVIEPPSKFLWVLGKDRADAFVKAHVRSVGMAGGRPVSQLVR